MAKRPAVDVERLRAALVEAARQQPGQRFLYADTADAGVIFHPGLPDGSLTVSRQAVGLLVAAKAAKLLTGASYLRPDGGAGDAQEIIVRTAP